MHAIDGMDCWYRKKNKLFRKWSWINKIIALYFNKSLMQRAQSQNHSQSSSHKCIMEYNELKMVCSLAFALKLTFMLSNGFADSQTKQTISDWMNMKLNARESHERALEQMVYLSWASNCEMWIHTLCTLHCTNWIDSSGFHHGRDIYIYSKLNFISRFNLIERHNLALFVKRF